jgi:hypothetical protein
MSAPEFSLPTKGELTPVKVDLGRTKAIISKEYDSIPDGLQKEAIQNAWDNRLDETHAKNWKIEIRYDPVNHTLSIEDFGTTGIVRWDHFHALWFTDKDPATGKLGQHGQGKAMLHACGEYMIAETEVNGKYLCRYSTPEGYTDFEGKKLRALNHPGTLITIYKVYPDLRRDLSNVELMVRLIQLTWWEIIEEYGATIVYAAGSKQVIVPKLELPPATLKEFPDRIVQKGSTAIGVISKIRFYYGDAEIPEDLRGIAVNIRGQTIDRYRPPLIGHHGKKFFATGSAHFLKDAELASHSGFQRNHPAWKATREALDNLLQEFIAPMMKNDQTIAPKYRNLAREMLEEINEVLSEFPDMDPQSFVLKKKPTQGPAAPHTDVYFMSLVTDKPLYLRGETARITAHSTNPLPVRKEGFREEIQVRNPNNSVVWTTSQALNLDAKSEKTNSYLYTIPPDAVRGTYIVTAFVYNGAAVPRASRIKTFEVESLTTAGAKRKHEEDDGKGTQKKSGHGLRLIHPIAQRDESKPGPESYYDPEENMLVINFSHPTAKFLEHYDPKGFRYHIFKCATNELAKERFRRQLENSEQDSLSVQEIQARLNELFTRKQDFFAAWCKKAQSHV